MMVWMGMYIGPAYLEERSRLWASPRHRRRLLMLVIVRQIVRIFLFVRPVVLRWLQDVAGRGRDADADEQPCPEVAEIPG